MRITELIAVIFFSRSVIGKKFEGDLSFSQLPVCRTTEWSDSEVEVRCHRNETESYSETIGPLVSRRCCPTNLGMAEAEVETQISENCKVLPCQNIGANPRGHDLCAGLPTRHLPRRFLIGRAVLTYKEAIRESCVIPGVKMSAEAVCCPTSTSSSQRISSYAAEAFEFPYVAHIYNSETGSRCGGAIYNEYFIITASHCVVNSATRRKTPPEDISVIVGTNIALLENRHFHPGFRNVIENHPHPNYSGFQKNSNCLVNDFAMLKVDSPMKFGDEVKAIKIAPDGFDPLKYGSHAVNAGWGIATNFRYQPYLCKANLKLRSDAMCFQGIGATYPWNATCDGVGDRQSQFLCLGGLAKGEGVVTKDTIPTNPAVLGVGNSGGPVVCRDKNGDSLLCGIVSSGGNFSKCIHSRTEEGCRFTRASEVSHFRTFIQNIAGSQENSQLFEHKSFGTVVINPTEFQHQVYIISPLRPCAGTLVTRDTVVTAAHCVIRQNPNLEIITSPLKPKEVAVIPRTSTGTWDSNLIRVKSIHIAPGVRPLIVHWHILRRNVETESQIHNFTIPVEQPLFVHDVAVLKLTRDVDIAPDKLAELPRVGSRGIHFPAGISGVELSIARKERPDANQLLSHSVSILSLAECRERYKRVLLPHTPDGLLCGVEKHSGGSLCDRLIGGGVIRKLQWEGNTTRDVLVGMSVVRMCQLPIPVVYMNMRLYSSWIERVVGNI